MILTKNRLVFKELKGVERVGTKKDENKKEVMRNH